MTPASRVSPPGNPPAFIAVTPSGNRGAVSFRSANAGLGHSTVKAIMTVLFFMALSVLGSAAFSAAANLLLNR